MSRPEKPINWILVDNLLEAGCLGTEIAAHFDMHPNTFYDRVVAQYNMSFTEYSTLKHQKGESILRAVQYAKATGQSKKGDNTLLMFLGRVRLNQDEHKDVPLAPNDNLMNFADAYIKAEAERMEMVKKLQQIEDELNEIKSKSGASII